VGVLVGIHTVLTGNFLFDSERGFTLETLLCAAEQEEKSKKQIQNQKRKKYPL
jgi:hypothetical protein